MIDSFADSLFLAQNIKVTYWLTPVWILSMGIAIGFLLAILGLIKIWILQRIPGLNSVASNRGSFLVAGAILSAVYVALYVAFLYWYLEGNVDFASSKIIFALCFVTPFCCLLGFGAWNLIAKRYIGELGGFVSEGLIKWLNRICIAFTTFAVLGVILGLYNGFGFVKFVDEPLELMDSLARVPFVGTTEREYTIPPSSKSHTGDKIDVSFDGRELSFLTFLVDEPIEVSTAEITPTNNVVMRVEPSDDATRIRQRSDGKGFAENKQIDHFYVNNVGNSDATLRLGWKTKPAYSEVIVIPVIAFCVLVLYLLCMILTTSFPKIAAIALSTFKTEVSQPLFLLVTVLGSLFIVLSIYIPYNTFGEDIKMYKDSGLNLLRVMAIFTAIWAASKSVAEEIEGRTALTVLSKPVGRRQFILGKFSGISMAIGLMFLLLGLWFVIWVAYKPVYDGQESNEQVVDWTLSFIESFNVIPGLVLCFLEAVVFVAISVAISTRLGILANFLICAAIYVLGHLTPLLVQSSYASFELVVVFAQLVAIIFPVLNHYDIQAAISTNSAVPLEYIGWSFIYTALYGAIAMLVALVLFEDRDLA
jgi:ABC-type transport system involved in multi-copper enzyme maturation permease subunit